MKTKLMCIMVLCFIAFSKAYSAQVGFFVGEVNGERKGAPFKISLGLALEAGDVIRTGSKSTVEIRYKDRTSINVAENTLITIGNANIPASSEVTVVSGRALAIFSRRAADINRVYTPTTVAAIRGTEFSINVNKGNSMIILNKGKLDVNNPYSQVSLNAGDNVRANVGEEIERSTQRRKQWNEGMSDLFDNDLDRAIAAYSKYVNDFDSSAKSQSGNMKGYSNQIKSATSEEELRGTGRSIEALEALMKNNLFLTQGTDYSLKLILEEMSDKSSKEFDEFSKIKERSNAVVALKARNYAEIQAIKHQHKEAVERIRSRFEADRARILEGVQRQRERNQ